MRNTLIFFLFVWTNSLVSLRGQSTPDWILSDSNSVGTSLGLCLNEAQDKVAVWGIAIDTNCSVYNVGLVIATDLGSLDVDTSFELGYCSDETPVHLIANTGGNEFLYFTDNNVITVQDCTFCYRVDSGGTIQSSAYTGEIIRSRAVSNGIHTFVAADDPVAGKAVLRIDSLGNVSVLNTISDPYFVTAPRILLATSSRVFEIYTRNTINDTAAVCYIYDTSGVFQSSFSIDVDPGTDEIVSYAFIVNNAIFFVCQQTFTGTTYTAATDLNGVVFWRDTIADDISGYKAACVDAINNRAYIRMQFSGQLYDLYSIDLLTGAIIDSVRIDSVGATPNGSTINSGPAGGVFFTYMKFGTNTVFSEQYDASLNLLWTGALSNPVCNTATYPVDVAFDSSGSLYIVAKSNACPSPTILAKFTPSMVGVDEDVLAPRVLVYPNPAVDYFTIELPRHYENNTEVLLMDITGKTIHSFVMSGPVVNVPTGDLPEGMYIIRVSSEGGETTTVKQIIQK